MEPLPEEVEAALLRGISAYLKATPANELPPGLRRFQNFRPQALKAQRRRILDSLDDPALRSLIGEWLDDKTSLAKGDASTLRVAVEREEGWAGSLSRKGAARAKKTPAKTTAHAPPLELAKIRKARDDARKRQQAAEREALALAARIVELEARLAAETERTAALTKEAVEARRNATNAAASLEREQRKSRAATDRARAAEAKARSELKESRRELQTLRREFDKLKAAQTRRPPPPKQARSPSGPRKALAVPKGRFEDAPETLDRWLDAPDVHLLVDGYNASMSRSGFGNLDLAAQRDRLVDELLKLARRKKVKATVVFDGSDVTSIGRKPRGPVRVQYSAPDEIADDHLVALLEAMPPTPVVVATNDRELQERAASLGATVATSDQLLGLLR